MKKQCLKYILAFTLSLLLLMLLPTNSFSDFNSSGYTIESYDIDMVVNEDNTFNITETITAYFDTAKHRNI